jgi:hypothetical protein
MIHDIHHLFWISRILRTIDLTVELIVVVIFIRSFKDITELIMKPKVDKTNVIGIYKLIFLISCPEACPMQTQ